MSRSADSLFEQAKRLEAEADSDGAIAMYRQALEVDPGDFRARNNLALLLADGGDLCAALNELLRARNAKDDEPVIHFNIANLLQRQDRFEAALGVYRRCLELGGESAAVYYNMASALESCDEDDEAEHAYRQALELAPNDHRIVSNLGALRLRKGDLDGALPCFRRAVELNPGSALDHFNVAKVLDESGDLDGAVAAYRQSLVLNPAADSCRYRLVSLLQRRGRTEAARAELDRWLALFPDSPTAKHLNTAFAGDASIGRASPEYIRETFDGFADSFEQTLSKLQYRAPALIAKALQSEVGPPRGVLRILDVGCGTGLSGLAVADWASELVGIDLSNEMLEKASAKGVYDRLEKHDVETFLAEATERFDAIVSVDTLCYFGALESVMASAARALTADGLLAFTLERAAIDCPGGFTILPHGRFCHTEAYARAVVEATGLAVRRIETDVLRWEAGQPVRGIVMLARPLRSATGG